MIAYPFLHGLTNVYFIVAHLYCIVGITTDAS
jgi:hypothetical protein